MPWDMVKLEVIPIALDMWQVNGKSESSANGNRAMEVIAARGVSGKRGNGCMSRPLWDIQGI